jgi:hypothetical protein
VLLEHGLVEVHKEQTEGRPAERWVASRTPRAESLNSFNSFNSSTKIVANNADAGAEDTKETKKAIYERNEESHSTVESQPNQPQPGNVAVGPTCPDWKETGEGIPEETFRSWLVECCVLSKQCSSSMAALHRDFSQRSGRACNRGAFAAELERCGFPVGDDGMITGLALAEDVSDWSNSRPSKSNPGRKTTEPPVPPLVGLPMQLDGIRLCPNHPFNQYMWFLKGQSLVCGICHPSVPSNRHHAATWIGVAATKSDVDWTQATSLV